MQSTRWGWPDRVGPRGALGRPEMCRGILPRVRRLDLGGREAKGGRKRGEKKTLQHFARRDAGEKRGGNLGKAGLPDGLHRSLSEMVEERELHHFASPEAG
ncbi:hypothetical protein NDU88_001879 [Pleurodeles waltl]|uniref:Uncharacterized protein n=1 Tax=Pleurodeles waltl TaxID=8319 RepID=A0AAV7KQQ5_PLEWA|nr:hypothetical protein NDU88_001879 [Pleurodeles waltl]